MNKLIVEGKSDQAFVKALVNHLNLPNIEFENPPLCKIDKYDCLEGEGALGTQLKRLINSVKSSPENINKIGIILDIDRNGLEKRINFVNKQLKKLDKDLGKQYRIIEPDKFISLVVPTDDEYDKDEVIIQLACHFMNVDGIGELETVLKAIKAEPSSYADCLIDWRNCLKNKAHEISDKEFDKLWLHYYIRYDTCDKDEKRKLEEYCNIRQLDSIFEKQKQKQKKIFNFDDDCLNDLKAFLRMFE